MRSPLELCHTIMLHLRDDQVQECCKYWQTVKEAQEFVMQNLHHDPEAMEKARVLLEGMLKTPCSSCGLIACKIAHRNEWWVEDPNDDSSNDE